MKTGYSCEKCGAPVIVECEPTPKRSCNCKRFVVKQMLFGIIPIYVRIPSKIILDMGKITMVGRGTLK